MANPRAMILCIDDDGLGLEARKELLEISGYDVLTASSGQEGLRLFASHLVDAVIVDYQMPGMSGDRVASEMKRVKPHVPILMLSAFNDLARSKLMHVDAFLCKSESWPKVLSALDRLLLPRLPFFDRWWESWKHRRHHTGNSLMGADSRQSNRPSRTAVQQSARREL